MKTLKATERSIHFTTANGTITVDTEVEVEMKFLPGKHDVKLLADAPPALAIGVMCSEEDDYNFWWPNRSGKP